MLNISEFHHLFIFTCHMCGYTIKARRENNNYFIANSLLNPIVKAHLKSANIWQSYKQIMSLVFFDSQYIYVLFLLVCAFLLNVLFYVFYA